MLLIYLKSFEEVQGFFVCLFFLPAELILKDTAPWRVFLMKSLLFNIANIRRGRTMAILGTVLVLAPSPHWFHFLLGLVLCHINIPLKDSFKNKTCHQTISSVILKYPQKHSQVTVSSCPYRFFFNISSPGERSILRKDMLRMFLLWILIEYMGWFGPLRIQEDLATLWMRLSFQHLKLQMMYLSTVSQPPVA